ncbi:MAG: tRNA pseudouridine(55) synthase TruB [Candidatus Melainabacteria bacterium]|nr:tRNA pseudouridine(55) synthase TruB [Candidatus Melainabacteria bacterium]MBI3309518.1 tRNA pseudouridine(55) synthase TruB [Candidatus Melainabacteria bacterium]
MQTKNPSGFLNICKPSGCTSHDVVRMLKKQLGIKKVGHSGTLDPLATGVLVIGINDATRLFEYLNSDKTYIAEITFGIKTDTDDITGNITQQKQFTPDIKSVKDVISQFVGKNKQKPPVYSAVKINGRRAYNLARKGELNLEQMKEREFEIYSIDFISCNTNKLKIKVHCSAGTYIRSLARDIGEKLDTFGTLSSLERTSVGDFNITTSLDPSLITPDNLPFNIVSPISVLSLSKFVLTPQEVTSIKLGKFIEVNSNTINKTNLLQLIDRDDKLIAIGEFIEEKSTVKPKKVFITS